MTQGRGVRAWWLGLAASIFAWAYPSLSLAAGNQGELVRGAWMRPALVLAFLGGFLFATLSRLLRSSRASLIVCVVAMFWTFQFRTVALDAVEWMHLLTDDQALAMALCTIPWAVGFGLSLAVALRWLRHRAMVPEAFALAALVLVVQPAWQLARGNGQSDNPFPIRSLVPPSDLAGLPATPAEVGPDVYVIVLDAYGRDDALRHYLGIDNSEFVRALEQRGFLVARHSQANYNQTLLALPSLMEMAPIQDLPIPAGSKEVVAAARFLDEGRGRKLLEKHGLRTVSIPTATVLTALPTADWLVADPDENPAAGLRPLERLLWIRTPLALVPVRETGAAALHRHQLETGFRMLPEVARQPWAKFVFAHILLPHPPFVFGADGRPLDPPSGVGALEDGAELLTKLPEAQYRRQFADQLRYTNQRLLETVDEILDNSRRPSVIVLMGDHGSRMKTDFRRREKTDPGESSRILMAIRVPDPRPSDREVVDHLSPVNVLRFVLSTRFGEELALLPNEGWYSPMTDAFAFERVPDASARLDDATGR